MSEDITPSTIRSTLLSKDYSKALIMSLKLNEVKLTKQVYETIPPESIQLVVQTIASSYIERLMNFIVGQIDTSPHIEFHLKWLEAILYQHSGVLQSRTPAVVSTLRAVQKAIGRKFDDISKICQFNRYTLQYVLTLGGLNKKRQVENVEAEDQDHEMSQVLG